VIQFFALEVVTTTRRGYTQHRHRTGTLMGGVVYAVIAWSVALGRRRSK